MQKPSAYISFFISCLFIFTQCVNIEADDHHEIELLDDGLYHDVPKNIGVQNTINRAKQFANICWTPKGKIPRFGGHYKKGEVIVGAPYSSGKELCTFIGQDVSFYSFLSAVYNPYSYLYTEDTSKPPYNSTLCKSYYGTVCSAAVDYALGIDIPYATYMYDSLPLFEKLKNQTIDYLELGDILLQNGHVGMVYDIIRDAHYNIVSIDIFEAVTSGVRIIRYDTTDFLAHWDNVNWVAYRYQGIDNNTYTPNEYVPINGEPPVQTFNNYLSTAKGDKVAYAERDSVIINILNDQCLGNHLIVNKDGSFYEDRPISGNKLVLYDLPYGSYEAYISIDGNANSPSINFEVLNYDVSIVPQGIVSFSSKNSDPVYIVICAQNHKYISLYELSDSEKALGYALLNKDYKQNAYYKVVFQGEYGRVCSLIAPIN